MLLLLSLFLLLWIKYSKLHEKNSDDNDIYDNNFRRETETALFQEGRHYTVDIEKIETLNTICKG